MISFAKRNLKLFFKDKSAVFFSLLGVFIIIGLYALFLGDVWTKSLDKISNARALMDCWIMAGLVAVTSVTTTMGAFGTMVDDKVKKISKDFSSSPLKRSSIAGGYIVSAYVIGVIMSVVALVLAQIYLVASGGAMLSFVAIVKCLGLILLATLTSTSIVLFIVSFFSSVNAFATASTVIGTLIGFLTGIYLPVGNLPDTVQTFVKIFPISHAAVLLRQVVMKDQLKIAFKGAPAEYLTKFNEMMGVTFKFGEYEVTTFVSIAILIGTAVLFFILSILNISRKKR
ncbi:ABC transporter permease [Clostridium sp. KNHs214]|uniref:ABC transporter permease n=1 Tax=Clostridium sp. KNHs214 TaxID=1540257 RepID=UPI00054E41A2|nr:ABC transporter permease [Clostridium sp. KNHs214]